MDVERLEAALRLLPAKKGKPTPVTLAALKAIRIAVQRGGRSMRVSLGDATTDELVNAASEAERPKLPAPPAEVIAARDAVHKKLNSGAGALGDVYVRFRGKKRVLVEVPIERAGEFQARLR